MKDKTILLIGFFMFLTLLSSSAFAISIGISPGKIEFWNILQGGYAENIVTVSTNEAENVSVEIKPGGDLGRWTRFEPNESTFIINKDHPKKIKVIIEPSQDARLKTYKGTALFVADAAGNFSGRAGGYVKSSVILLLEMNTTGIENIQCTAGGFYSTDIELNSPLEIGYTIRNAGNVRLQPSLEAEIWDQERSHLLLSKEFIYPGEILPTTEQEVSFTLNQELGLGDYSATLNLKECDIRTSTSFSVLPPGSIVDKGILESLSGKTWAEPGEVIPLIAVFQNLGTGPVLAKLKGEISLDGSVVDVIESESLEVGREQKIPFQHYFTPKEEGRYVVKARVIYNNKLTDEKGTIINVKAEDVQEGQKFNFLVLLVYLVIFLTIFFLMRKVMRRRKKYQ